MTVSRNHQDSSDWEQQFERLSAYLDNELDEAERAALEHHLPTCEECRNALDELRQTRAMLRALPAPASPRSFLIPETGAVPEPLARRAITGTSSARHARRGHVLQWAGGLVAAVGLFLLISSALPAALHTATSGPGGASSASGASGIVPEQHTPSIAAATQKPNSPGIGGPTRMPTLAPTRGVTEPTIRQPHSRPPISSENAIPLGPIAGVLLLLLGAGLLLGGTLFLRRL